MSTNPAQLPASRREALIDYIIRELCATEVRPLQAEVLREMRAIVAQLVAAFLAALAGRPYALADLVHVIASEVPASRRPDLLLRALELLDERASDFVLATHNIPRAERDLRRVSRAIRPARDELTRMVCLNSK